MEEGAGEYARSDLHSRVRLAAVGEGSSMWSTDRDRAVAIWSTYPSGDRAVVDARAKKCDELASKCFDSVHKK